MAFQKTNPKDPRNSQACTHLYFIAQNVGSIDSHATGIADKGIADRMIPNLRGINGCRRLKVQMQTRDIPVIMLCTF